MAPRSVAPRALPRLVVGLGPGCSPQAADILGCEASSAPKNDHESIWQFPQIGVLFAVVLTIRALLFGVCIRAPDVQKRPR